MRLYKMGVPPIVPAVVNAIFRRREIEADHIPPTLAAIDGLRYNYA